MNLPPLKKILFDLSGVDAKDGFRAKGTVVDGGGVLFDLSKVTVIEQSPRRRKKKGE